MDKREEGADGCETTLACIKFDLEEAKCTIAALEAQVAVLEAQAK